MVRITRGCRALAALMLIPAAAGCAQKTSIVLDEPLDRTVRTESNSHSLMAWTDAGVRADVLIHIDASDEIAIIPASMAETFRNTAAHLEKKNSAVINRVATIVENSGTVNLGLMAGFYKRVVWVIPYPGSISDLPLENFKQALSQGRGFPAGELADLTMKGKHITGTLAGVPLTVTSLGDLEIAEGEKALLDIDLAYFTGMQSSSKGYQPGTASLLDFLEKIRDAGIPAIMATINRSTGKRSSPLDIRYFAEIIEETLRDPSLLGEESGSRYSRMIKAEEALVTGRYGEAATIYSALTGEWPDKAGLHFSHAFALGFSDRGTESSEALVKAYAIDVNYIKGFFQLARVLGANGHVEAGEALLEAPDLRNTLPRVEVDYQRGLFYFESQLYDQAKDILEDVAKMRPADFALRTILYRVYLELDDREKMQRTLYKLVDLDENRVVRDMPWAFKELGDLSLESGSETMAVKWYRKYLLTNPDDPDRERIEVLVESYGPIDP